MTDVEKRPEDEAAQQRRQDAGSKVSSLAYNALQSVSLILEDPAHLTEQPILPGWQTKELRARPLTRLQAAVWLQGEARRVAWSEIGKARSAGATWLEIAGVLDLVDGDGYEKATAAYEYAAKDSFSDRFHFDCGSCGARITDHGPYDPHPVDQEEGHTETCTRQAAAIAAWKARNPE